VSTLRRRLETGRLTWAALPEATILEQELRDFRVKISPALNERFEHRTGAHDDLLLSVAERLG